MTVDLKIIIDFYWKSILIQVTTFLFIDFDRLILEIDIHLWLLSIIIDYWFIDYLRLESLQSKEILSFSLDICMCMCHDFIFSPTPVCSWWILCSKIKFLYFQHLAKNSLLDFSALSVTLTLVNYILRVTPLVHTTCRLRLANFINILLCRIASILVISCGA